MESPLYFQARIRVQSYSFVSYSELAPFLDELNKRYNTVETAVYDFEPPAAGFSEIALTVAVGAPATYASAFLVAWAAEDAKALRRKLLDVMRRSKENEHGRRYIPLRVQIGRVRFYFHEQVGDDELVERLRAAQEYAAALPEEAFDGEPGPGEYGLFWDERSKSWKGAIYGYREGRCMPVRVLTTNPGDVICYED